MLAVLAQVDSDSETWSLEEVLGGQSKRSIAFRMLQEHAFLML
jgi:hypothetical protein